MSNVSWDQDVCSHAGKCVQGLPQVFKVENGEFVIDENAASAEQIKNTVAQCPSGALQFKE